MMPGTFMPAVSQVAFGAQDLTQGSPFEVNPPVGSARTQSALSATSTNSAPTAASLQSFGDVMQDYRNEAAYQSGNTSAAGSKPSQTPSNAANPSQTNNGDAGMNRAGALATSKSSKPSDSKPDKVSTGDVEPNQLSITAETTAAQNAPLLPLHLALPVFSPVVAPAPGKSEENSSGKASEKAEKDTHKPEAAPAVTVPAIPLQLVPMQPIPVLTFAIPTPALANKNGEKNSAYSAGSSLRNQSSVQEEAAFRAGAAQEPSEEASSRPGELAFAARLTVGNPAADGSASGAQTSSASAGASGQLDPARPNESMSVEDNSQKHAPATAGSDSAGSRNASQDAKDQPSAEAEPAAKLEPSAIAVTATSPFAASSAVSDNFNQAPSVAAQPVHLAQELEPPPAQPSSSNDFKVSIQNDHGAPTEVRFLDSGGQVKVSVRTGDSGLAETLRSGLNDLTTRLTSQGIQTEVWKGGSGSSFGQSGQQDSSFLQNRNQDGSAHQSTDPNGSGNPGSRQQGQNTPQQNPIEQNTFQQSKPQWLQELETSSGLPSPA
jgi:hypothetical protein